MNDKVEELVAFIQERCLWQFFSRTWDREENIDGILTKVEEILTEKPFVLETPADKCFYADAKILAMDMRKKLSWVEALDKAQTTAILDGTKARITEIVVTKSQNGELNVPNY